MDIQHIKNKYKDKMLMISFIVSQWSPEPAGQQHGAVLAVDGKYLVATGFNGPDRSWDGHNCGGTCCTAPIVHAEINALLNLEIVKVDPKHCIAFISKKPCEPCMRALTDAGVKAVFWLQAYSGQDSYQVIA